MRRVRKIILFMLTFIILYFIGIRLYFIITGEKVYIVSQNVDVGTCISGEMVKMIRINSYDGDYVSESPVGKYAAYSLKPGKILTNSDILDDHISFENQRIAINVDNVDNKLKNYIVDSGYVTIYYIKGNKVSSIYSNIKVIDVEIIKDLNSRFILEVSNEMAKEIQLIKKEGEFEIGFWQKIKLRFFLINLI